MRSRHGNTSLLSRPSYWLETFKYIEKSFVYVKVNYWSSNYIQQKNNNLKKKLVIVIPNIKYCQVMNKIYNAKSSNMKVSIMMKA